MPRLAALIAGLVAATTLTLVPSSNATARTLAPPSAPDGRGTSWFSASDGRAIVVKDGVASMHGAAKWLNKPIVGIANTPSGRGYWQVAADGGVFTAGDARFFGSTGGLRLNQPIVGVAATPTGRGYWLAAADGGVFTFGDARFLGGTGGRRLNRPIVGIAATPSGRGYWLAAADGGVFGFGDARFYGGTGGIRLNQPIVGIAATPSGRGYWLAGADGGIFTFGDARYLGSVRLAAPRTVGLSSDGSGGYAVLRADSSTSTFRGNSNKDRSTTTTTAPPATTTTAPTGGGGGSTATTTTTTAPPTTTTTAPPTTPSGTTTTTTTSTTVPSSAGSAVGVFTGPGNYQPGGLNGFGSNTGTTPVVGVDFMDMTHTWNDFANVNWLLDPWTSWLKANPSRRLVLSVPMLINSAKGQYDNTSFDQYHRQVAANIAGRGIASQVVIRLGWEMNGTWYPWSTSADGFKRMWRRLVPQYRAASSAFKFDWCSNGGSASPESWYPGDDVVDIIAMDQYDIVWQKPGGDPNWRWSQIQPHLQWHANFAAAHGKKAAIDEWALVSLSETQTGGGGDNPTYINNMANWGASHGYAWLAYFNVAAGGPSTTLEKNPNALNAYRNKFK